MTELETQVRGALDQLAAPIEHGAECEPGPLWRCTCDYEERLLAAWSQATARAITRAAIRGALCVEFGHEGNHDAHVTEVAVAALRKGEAPR